MALDPPIPPFLGSTAVNRPAAIVVGAPLDLTESFRTGTAAAPQRIRIVSDVLETYSPTWDADLSELPLADWGDVRLADLAMEEALAVIDATVGQAMDVGLPIMLGGEHTATIGAIRAAHRRYPDLIVVQVDAHADLREEYAGATLSHATVMRRIADDVGLDRIVQCGIRSGVREEFELARSCLSSGRNLDMNAAARAAIKRAPIYLTIDIDALDPASAPGTGCPEPGGPTFAELLEFIATLAGCNLVGVDVMEVLPAADSNDITSIAAAKLVREMALAFGPQASRQHSARDAGTRSSDGRRRRAGRTAT
jgi:agmatinase